MKSSPTESLADQWALVTGASGGIGGQIARELASEGANLILHTHRNATTAKKLADEISELGPRAEVVECDFSDNQKCLDFADAVWQIASLDILVNNAGVDVLTGEAADWSFEANGLIPLISALFLALVSNEAALVRRRAG